MSGAPSPLREIYGAASGSAAHGRLWEYPPSMHPRSGGQAPWSMIPRQPKWEEKTARRSPYSSPERHREVPKEEEVDDEPPSPREDMAKILAEAAKAAAEAAKAAEQAKVAAEEEYKRQKAAAVRLAVEPASPKADPEAPKPVRKHVPKRIGPVDVPSRYWAAHVGGHQSFEVDDEPPELHDWQPSRRPLCYFYEPPETFDETACPVPSLRVISLEKREEERRIAVAAASAYEAAYRAAYLAKNPQPERSGQNSLHEEPILPILGGTLQTLSNRSHSSSPSPRSRSSSPSWSRATAEASSSPNGMKEAIRAHQRSSEASCFTNGMSASEKLKWRMDQLRSARDDAPEKAAAAGGGDGKESISVKESKEKAAEKAAMRQVELRAKEQARAIQQSFSPHASDGPTVGKYPWPPKVRMTEPKPPPVLISPHHAYQEFQLQRQLHPPEIVPWRMTAKMDAVTPKTDPTPPNTTPTKAPNTTPTKAPSTTPTKAPSASRSSSSSSRRGGKASCWAALASAPSTARNGAPSTARKGVVLGGGGGGSGGGSSSSSKKPHPPSRIVKPRKPAVKTIEMPLAADWSAAAALADGLPSTFEGLSDGCAFCGAALGGGGGGGAATCKCDECGIQYCSEEHHASAWMQGHKHSCGCGLPTPSGVLAANASTAMGMLQEFGGAQRAVAEAALCRLAVLLEMARLHSHSQLPSRPTTPPGVQMSAKMSASASPKASAKAHPTVKPLWTTHLSPSHPAWRPPVAAGGGVELHTEVHGGESFGAGAAHIHIHTRGGLRDRLDAAAEEALQDVAATSIQAASRGRAGRRAAAAARDAAYADADHEDHSHSQSPSSRVSSPDGRHGGRLAVTGGKAGRPAAMVATRMGRYTEAEEAALLRVSPVFVAGLVRAMGTYRSAAELQSLCGRILCLLSELGKEQSRELLCQHGALESLCHAIRTHSTDGNVLRWAAMALLGLTADSAVRSHLAVEAGAEEALRLAMQAAQPVTARQRQQGSKASRTPKPAWFEKVSLAHQWLVMHGKLLAKPILEDAKTAAAEMAAARNAAAWAEAAAAKAAVEKAAAEKAAAEQAAAEMAAAEKAAAEKAVAEKAAAEHATAATSFKKVASEVVKKADTGNHKGKPK